MQPIEDWDEQYITSVICAEKESEGLEFKAAASFGDKGPQKQEMAQEICAFANSGDGFLVYGIGDSGLIDAAVPPEIGRQPVESWVQAIIPKLHHPPIVHCRAKHIPFRGHLDGAGILVIHTPLSERRPHWSTQAGREIAYIRAGEHSAPMRLQTLLDISSRGTVPHCEFQAPTVRMASTVPVQYEFRLCARLVSGPICRTWGVEVRMVDDNTWNVEQIGSNGRRTEANTFYFTGEQPLLPKRWTEISDRGKFVLRYSRVPHPGKQVLRATLYAESAEPVVAEWDISGMLDTP